MPTASPAKVAILDDYQSVSLSMADWSPLDSRADIIMLARRMQFHLST
jgi:hypothetical protein